MSNKLVQDLRPARTNGCDCDLLIIGGGPAGLSAAINGASEGLSVLIIDSNARLGGQASESTMIENYPGFPDGLTGATFVARTIVQASKFGTSVLCPVTAEGIELEGDHCRVHLKEEKEAISAAAVLLCIGVTYRRFVARDVGLFMGRGISYGLPEEVRYLNSGPSKHFIVGAANSAGQAALFVAQNKDAEVTLLVRGESLDLRMSTYLIERINAASNINVMTQTEVVAAGGGEELESLTLDFKGRPRTEEANYLSIFIGAQPSAGWLDGQIARDKYGFVLTDRDIPADRWKLERQPFQLETSLPGVFAAGDMRSGSIKRVASAVGEGAVAIPAIHQYLQSIS